MIQGMTSSLEIAEFRYNRAHAAPFQSHGAPPKIMPRLIFHSTIQRIVNPLFYWYGSRLTQGFEVGRKIWRSRFRLWSRQMSAYWLWPLSRLHLLYQGCQTCLHCTQIIKHGKIQAVFPNVETILRLFLCLVVTNCSGERSFSKLKRIKSVLRSTMS